MQNVSRVSLTALFFMTAAITLSGCKPVPKGMALIPRGEFIMGTNELDVNATALQYGSRKPWFANARPARKVYLDDYYMDKTEVINASYKEFTDATGYRLPPNWVNGAYPAGHDSYPVTHADWNDAVAFCKWKGKRLPTEAEWEKAARGTDGRTFPWGNEFDIKKANTNGQYGATTPVGSFPDGNSPYGLADMAGNVMEWTADWYEPYTDNDYHDSDYGKTLKVVRGGGWGGVGHYSMDFFIRPYYRTAFKPYEFYDDLGFRCVKSRR